MTMAYQDLIRKGKNGKLICMSRVGSSRHQRTITVVNIRTLMSMAQEQAAAPLSYRDGEIRPDEVTARLVNRALMFHRVMTTYRRTGDRSNFVDVCPPNTCIHSSDRARPAEEVKGTEEQISNTSPSVTSVAGPGTGSGSVPNTTPVRGDLGEFVGLQEALE